MVKSWINGDIPLDSLLMTAVIATLRVLYTGRSWRRLLLEVPLCCLLAVAAFSMIKPIPVSWLSALEQSKPDAETVAGGDGGRISAGFPESCGGRAGR
ncbi:hypothetical protein GL392_08575 [Salmonella enterica]|nr:hypothetical protein [Salmonella enterica]EEN5776688.1 hypothetical protein [Salmonella enterica]